MTQAIPIAVRYAARPVFIPSENLMRDDFSNLRAERDEPVSYRAASGPSTPRQSNLTLQIAMGIWLGGVALGITGWVVNVLLIKFGMQLVLP